ncbi:MAG: translation initiation factor IF-2, partial [Candidatus Brocadia sp.]
MGNIRISLLAKELGVKSNLLIDKCHEKGLSHITHHANTLIPEQAEMIRQLFKPLPKVAPAKDEPKVKEPITPREAEQKKEDKTPAQVSSSVKVVQPAKIVRIPKGPPQPQRMVKIAPTKTFWKKKRPPSVMPVKRKELEGGAVDLQKPTVKERETKIVMEPPITVKDLSAKLGIRANEIITKLLLGHNVRSTINQILAEDIVQLLGIEYGVEIEIKKKEMAEERDFIAEQISTKAEDMVYR